jgi:hypothetical protein
LCIFRVIAHVVLCRFQCFTQFSCQIGRHIA